MDRVTEADLPEVTAFLRGRIEQAMFPLSNLANYGLDGDHAYAPRMWAKHQAGQVTSVLTVTRNGSVMPACAPEDAAPILGGRTVSAVIGPAPLCRPLVTSLGLDGAQTILDRDEPQFSLDLAVLTVPSGRGALCPLAEADRDQMIDWRVAYEVEALGQDPETAAANGRRSYAGYIEQGSHAVLMDGGTPLSTTGFNARLPEIVQIGGVYTPPALRGRGHARRAVALHLAEARQSGVRRATLFAAGLAAIRAYEAVGFRQIGHWTLCLLKGPVDV